MQVIAIVFLYKKVGRAGVDLRGGGVQIRGGSHAGVMNKTMSVESQSVRFLPVRFSNLAMSGQANNCNALGYTVHLPDGQYSSSGNGMPEGVGRGVCSCVSEALCRRDIKRRLRYSGSTRRLDSV